MSSGRRVDDLLVVRLEGQPADPADNRLSTEPAKNISAPNARRGAEDNAGDDERRREWPPQTLLKNSHGQGSSGDCTWVGLGGFFYSRAKKSRHKRCGVQDPGRGTEPLMGCES